MRVSILTEKNAAVSNIHPIQIRRKPISIGVSAAPISKSRPDVPNSPTLVFIDSIPNDLLRKNIETTAKTKRTTSARSTTPIRVKRSRRRPDS